MNEERVIVNVLQHIIDDILNTVDIENLLIENLVLDDSDDDPLDDNVLANLHGHREEVDEVLGNIIQNIEQLEDVEDVLVNELLAEDDNEGEIANDIVPVNLHVHHEDGDDVWVNILENIQQVEYVEGVVVDELLMGGRHHNYRRQPLVVDIDNFRRLEDPTFYQHFRMTKQTFEVLVVEFGNHLTIMNRLQRVKTGLDICLMMGIWIMGNISSFRGTGAVFGVSASVIHFHYLVVIEALREMAADYIKWPTVAERARIKQSCERRGGLPGVVGMMDGTLIKVTAPLIQPARYFDRHHNYSINVLAVCDHKLCFRHVYVGEAGSVHDARVFKRSPLYNLFLERDDLLAPDEHILADSAYTLTRQVLVPYRHNAHLTHRQRRFNFAFCGLRMCIERSYGHLKEKNRRLYRLQVRNHTYAVDHIMASFVLHNFIKCEGHKPDGMELPLLLNGENEDEAEAAIIDREHPFLAEAREAGRRKREAIAELLTP